MLPEAQLYHYKARAYDPKRGVFLQTDPVGYKSDIDLYAYVGGDPTDKTDPTGTETSNFSNGDMNAGVRTDGRPETWQDAIVDTLNFVGPAIPVEGIAARLGESVWALGWGARGLAIEARLGGNLPAAFPTIDRFAGGVATSIKSMDLNAATYKTAANVSGTIDKYVANLAKFNGAKFSGVEIKSGQITGRQLLLAVPKGSMTAAQKAAIDGSTAAAAKQGVKVVVKEMK
jgi:hypothetical protein